MNRNKKHAFKLRRSNIILWPGIISGVALLAIGVLCLNPAPLENPAHATNYCTGPDGYVECDTSSSINTYARIAPVVSIGLQSDVVMDVTPKASGVFTEESVNVTVATNSSEGYSLYMRTLDDTNALTSIKKDDPTTIKAVEGEVEADALAAQGNVWGYKLNASSGETHDDLYRAVPATNGEQAIHVTGTKPITGTDSLDLTFGVHVDTSLPSGTYRNSVLVSAVANPVSITNLSELVFMQDMTSSICSNTAYDENGATTPEEADPLKPVTKQLIDTRDGKKYWVAKLKDGNCWMTQNLALDLGPDITLTPADSDVTSNWSANVATTQGQAFRSTDNAGEHSSNQGNYIVKNPTINTHCGDVGANMLSVADPTCENIVLDVTDYKAATSSDAPVYDETEKTYNAHYSLGNHYQWNAATAGSGRNATIEPAMSSICPRGWRLIGGGWSGDQFNFEELDSLKLLRSYGWSGSLNTNPNNGNTSVAQTEGAINFYEKPIYLNTAGIIYGNNSRWLLSHVGRDGEWWSSNPANATPGLTYALRFQTWDNGNGSLYAGISVSDARFSGYNVRCLAR